MKTGIFYGSSTGNTEDVAKRLANYLKVKPEDVYNVAKSKPSDVAPYDLLLLGTSTWGSGDLQEDWSDFINGLEMLDLKGKKIALFGCGDETMCDTFCGAVGELYKRLQRTNAEFIAPFEASEYHFDDTEARVDGKIVGLLLDEVNHPDLTDGRLSQWAELIKKEIG